MPRVLIILYTALVLLACAAIVLLLVGSPVIGVVLGILALVVLLGVAALRPHLPLGGRSAALFGSMRMASRREERRFTKK